MLLGQMFIYINHNLFAIYQFQIITFKGGTSANLGISSAISAISEIPALAGYVYLSRKKDNSFWIKFAAVMFSVKAITLFLAPNLGTVYINSALQMLAYAIIYPATLYYVNSRMEEGDTVKGQGYAAAAASIGSVVGSFFGGVILDAFDAGVLMLVGAVISVIGTVIVVYSLSAGKQKPGPVNNY